MLYILLINVLKCPFQVVFILGVLVVEYECYGVISPHDPASLLYKEPLLAIKLGDNSYLYVSKVHSLSDHTHCEYVAQLLLVEGINNHLIELLGSL